MKTVITFKDLQDAIEIIKLNRHKFEQVYAGGSNIFPALVILFLPPVVNLVLSSLLFPSGLGSLFSAVVFWPMMIPLLSLGGSIFALYFLLEKWFAFKVDLRGFFKVLAYGSVLLWLSIIPFLLDLIGVFAVSVLFNAVWMIGLIWFFVVAYNFLVSHLKIPQRDLLISMVVFIASYFLIQSILGRLLVGGYYRIFY